MESDADLTESGADDPDVKWLTAEELDSWLSVVRLMTWLPWSIDQQLQRDSKLGMVEYQVLAMLSESPQRTMRMSSLAEVTNASLSRLSRVVTRLEKRGLVRREPDPTDGRFTNAILTEDGLQTLAEAAPRPCRTCPFARDRRAVAGATATAWPRRRPHHVAHRHVCDQLTVPRPLRSDRVIAEAGQHLGPNRGGGDVNRDRYGVRRSDGKEISTSVPVSRIRDCDVCLPVVHRHLANYCTSETAMPRGTLGYPILEGLPRNTDGRRRSIHRFFELPTTRRSPASGA